MAFEHIDKYYW